MKTVLHSISESRFQRSGHRSVHADPNPKGTSVMNGFSRQFATTTVRALGTSLLVGALGLLSACTSTGKNDISGFDQITLSPGDTGQCITRPCRVFLKIPAGTGTYEVTGNEIKLGVYPAGETADLGGFWGSQAFEIKGMGVPKAYAYMPADR